MERVGGAGWRAARGVANSALVPLVLVALALPGRAQHPPRGNRTPPAERPAFERGRLEHVLAEAANPADLRRRLAGLEPEAIPLLFQVLELGALPAQPDQPERALTEDQLTSVRDALAARPRRELVPFLENLASLDPLPQARVEALRLLGAVGSREHLKLLVRLAAPARGPLSPEPRAAFGSALSSIVNRDPSALAHMRALFQEAPPRFSGSIVEALADVPAPEALGCLADMLGSSPGLDPLILARLAERGASGKSRIDEEVREVVRRYLERREEMLLVPAARAAGELGDDEAVEHLIGLMDHPDAHVRESVFAALQRLSGLSFGPDAVRWTSWYQAEMRWWNEQADEVLLRIEHGRGLEFTRAARLALEHRLFRDRVAESFAQALRRRDAGEVCLAARALEELRSPAAIRGLVECLERDEPGVREAAWRALRAITGIELPPEPDSWATLAG